MGIRKLRVQGDSKLIMKQVNREFVLKILPSCPTEICLELDLFSHLVQSYAVTHNRNMDVLATLASMTNVPGKAIDM